MIEIFRRKALLLVREIYFVSDCTPSRSRRDIDFYVQCRNPFGGSEPFSTVIVDLQQDKEALIGGLAKNFRYEIRRAAEKDRLTVHVEFSPSPDDVEEFRVFFDGFAAFRGIGASNARKLAAFRSAGCLALATARSGESNTLLAAHCFIFDDSRTRLYYSGTAPRSVALGPDNQLLGRANKFLHWQSMLAMKERGIALYDLGGLSSKAELKGVNDFKLQFGGVPLEESNAIIGVSCLGRMALRMPTFRGRA